MVFISNLSAIMEEHDDVEDVNIISSPNQRTIKESTPNKSQSKFQYSGKDPSATVEEDDAVFSRVPENSSRVLNSTLNAVQDQAKTLLKSPDIIVKPPPTNSNPKVVCDCQCSCSKNIDALVERKVREVTNKQLSDYFGLTGPFNTQLENLVSNILMNSTQQSSLMVESTKADVVDRRRSLSDIYEDFLSKHGEFEDKFSKFNAKADKMEADAEGLARQLSGFQKKVNVLDKQLNSLRLNTDEKMAKELDCIDVQINDPSVLPSVIQRLAVVEKQIEQHTIEIDNGNQYNRKDILVFKEIPHEGNRDFPEDCYSIIINFLRINLDIHITIKDISVCHRQHIPGQRKREGKGYIDPIYCKFLHRSLCTKILKQKHMLIGVKNIYGKEYQVKENLTPRRRELWDEVELKLGGMKRWTKNGNIFVKQNAKSRPTKVISELTISELMKKSTSTPPAISDKTCQTPLRKSPPDKTSVTSQINHRFWPMPSYAHSVGNTAKLSQQNSRSPILGNRPPVVYPNQCDIFAPSAAAHFSNNRLSTPVTNSNSLQSFRFKNKSLTSYNSLPF